MAVLLFLGLPATGLILLLRWIFGSDVPQSALRLVLAVAAAGVAATYLTRRGRGRAAYNIVRATVVALVVLSGSLVVITVAHALGSHPSQDGAALAAADRPVELPATTDPASSAPVVDAAVPADPSPTPTVAAETGPEVTPAALPASPPLPNCADAKRITASYVEMSSAEDVDGQKAYWPRLTLRNNSDFDVVPEVGGHGSATFDLAPSTASDTPWQSPAGKVVPAHQKATFDTGDSGQYGSFSLNVFRPNRITAFTVTLDVVLQTSDGSGGPTCAVPITRAS